MVVFELPAQAQGGGVRVACLGSCRVRNPIAVLGERGDLMVCATGLAESHTALEALQSLDFVAGRRDIPEALSRYIFEADRAPPIGKLKQAMSGGVDVFLLEISDDQVFSYQGVFLQQNFVTRNLVRPYGKTLLPWYRQLAKMGAAEDACVEETLEQLRQAGVQPDDQMAGLLRGLRLTRQSGEDIAKALAEMMAAAGGRWVVVSSFEIPEHTGLVMQNRRALNAKLAEAARQCGAAFYNPTELVAHHGPETALDGGGADIYEYAPAFYPTVGETLIDLALTGAAKPDSDSIKGQTITRAAARSDLAARVNNELVALHNRRLAQLGAAASGLNARSHQRMLESGALIGPREKAAFDLIDAYLPAYPAYSVLRAGLGELALLLAAGGRKTIAYEPNRRRREAIEAGAAHLAQIGLLEPAALQIRAERTPTGRDRAGLGVGINAVLARDEAAGTPLMKRMSVFDALLIHPRRFLYLREGPAEREKLDQELAGIGFDLCRDYERDALAWFRRSHPQIRSKPAGALAWLRRRWVALVGD